MIRFERAADGAWTAHADLAVAVETVPVTVTLGPWFDDAPDPAGLAGTPVLFVPPGADATLARAGALVAGRQPTVLFLPADAPALGGQYLVAVHEGVDVLVVLDGGADALTAARALGGRPILALPFDDPRACRTVLDRLRVDVHVPVPSLEGDRRMSLRALLADLNPESRHHVVEVDPRPAFGEEPGAATAASLTDLATAAAGVLAGRLAVGNRRWRDAAG